MAQEDLDTMAVAKDNVDAKTASDNAEPFGQPINDVLAAQAASDAGVKRASFIGYDEALDAYAARDDVESLENRKNRGSTGVNDFADGSFMRTDDGQPGSGSSA